MTFQHYTDILLTALQHNPKFDDVIKRKQEILDGVYRIENLDPVSVLFLGFNPAILSCKSRVLAVTQISDHARQFLDAKGIKYTYIDQQDLAGWHKKFQCVIAMDEFFTFADSDQDQQQKIRKICDLATDFVISTLRDYKNQEYKDREFSQPTMVRGKESSRIFVENHDWDLRDRTLWNSTVYEIDSAEGSLITHGPFKRRTMFFKQLAKFSMDAGAVNFLVHKDLMYKSLIKKNYEHVVSIQFD